MFRELILSLEFETKLRRIVENRVGKELSRNLNQID